MEGASQARRRVPVAIMVAAAAAVLVAGVVLVMNRAQASPGSPIAVSGEGVHFFSTMIIHSQEPTDSGMIQRSTDIVELSGDLEGFLLFHGTSTFDFAAGTLVNTGTQFFSGTILGSDPVTLHDSKFVFEVDLASFATVGEVFLGRSKDAPHPGHWWECELDVAGPTGFTEAGDSIVDYTGVCTPMGQP